MGQHHHWGSDHNGPGMIATSGLEWSCDGHLVALFEGNRVLVTVTPFAHASFARALAEHFTVHIIERRGRGRSSPQGDDYSMDKEREDVLALQQQTGAAFLVDHSFGG